MVETPEVLHGSPLVPEPQGVWRLGPALSMPDTVVICSNLVDEGALGVMLRRTDLRCVHLMLCGVDI